MDLGKGTGKTNTRRYNSEFKNRSYFLAGKFDKCYKRIIFFWISAKHAKRYTHGRICVYGRYAPGNMFPHKIVEMLFFLFDLFRRR